MTSDISDLLSAGFAAIGQPTSEPQKDFERRYASKSPGVVFGENMVSLPCTCEYGDGIHWAAIGNTQRAIKLHLVHENVFI